MNSIVSDVMLWDLVSRGIGTSSTNVLQLIRGFLGGQRGYICQLSDFKHTMSTVIIEVFGLKFKLQEIDPTRLAHFNAHGLISLECRLFSIQFKNGILEDITRVSQSKCGMNASLGFQYKSIVYPDKIYKIKIFANGMVQISGVKEDYEQSEVPYIMGRVLDIYKRLTGNVQLKFGAYYHALRNYNAQLTDVRLIDINTFVNPYKQNIQPLVAKCRKFGLDLLDVSTQNNRVIATLKFKVDAFDTGIVRYDPVSTSSRHPDKSITIQITKRGVVLISGTTGHFKNTFKVLLAINRMFAKMLTHFVLEDA